MLHSFIRNYIHLTWSTKDRIRIFTNDSKIQLAEFIMQKSREISVPVLSLNVQPEHIHILIELPSDQCLADTIQKIKGSSSYWINQQKLINAKHSWQRGYGAFSVSASQLDVVKDYIRKQDKHHKIKSFEEEYSEWKKNYGFLDD